MMRKVLAGFLAVFGLLLFSCSGEDTPSAQLSAEKEIITFRIVAPEVYGVINQENRTISVALPAGTDRSSLVPVIDVSSNATILPLSGVANNFTSPNVVYRVTAQDGSFADYLVTATNAPVSSACDLLSFSLEGVPGAIDHDARTVSVTLPQGTDLSSLKPVLSLSTWATVNPDADTAQNFASPVVYTVTAQDGSTSKAYTVTVTLAAVTLYTETFDNATDTGSTYIDGTSSANSAGIVWSFHGRTDGDAQIESGNKSLMIGKTGGFLGATLPNGCGKLSFRFKQGFSDTPAIKVLINGSVVYTTAVSGPTIQTVGPITINQSGSCTVRLETDPAGQRVIVDDVSWTDGGASETDKPTVVISAPASGANLTSSSTTVSGTAADPGASPSGVKEVWVQLDSGSPVKASGTTSWSTTVSGMGDGAHTVYVYAIDNAGNISTTVNVGFTVTLPVDTTNPTVAISTPTVDQSITGTAVTVTGTATDPGTDPSGVKEVWVKLDTTSWVKASGTTSWSYTFTSPADGSRTLSVYAVDNKDNNSTTATRNFTFTYAASAYPYIVGGVFQPQVGDPYYSYYSTAAGKTGDELRTALKSIISSGHSVPSYDGLWTAYSTSDRIPSGPNTGKIWDMYSDTGTGTGASYYFTYSSGQCGTYNSEGDCYNREHSWPKSWFGGTVAPMYSDLVHLVPTDGYVNNYRGNYAFGIVGSASWTSQNGSKLGSRSAQMTTWGCTESTVFEPIDAFKGDFARIYFYMCTRYWGTTEGGPMTSSNFRLLSWAQTMLKLWHENDAVSSKETSRNNAIQSIQHNRNPFVDYPGLVTIIDFTQ